MPQMIFINLPVTDLERSKRFYEAIGATNEPKFSDDTAAMMSFSETINVMLLTHDKFMSFSQRAIPDAKASAQMLLALTADNRGAVDVLVDQAAAAGGAVDPCPKQDYGFMYGRSFEDPDGHIWEVMWMDQAAVEQGPAAFEQADA